MPDVFTRLVSEIQKIEAQLHAQPELSFEEHETTRLIEEVLMRLPGFSRVELGLTTGTVWRLTGMKAGPVVGLRADIDAIRQEEQVQRPDRSRHAGIMHACGHDVHTASLLGAAMALSEMRESLCGDVVFIFQPAEEILQGAKKLIARGLFEKAPLDMLFGLHNQPALPFGTVGIKEGPLMAGKDDFVLELHGKGGHGGMPESCTDPIVAACSLVNALQTVVSRNVSPLDAAVLSVCSIHGGTEENLIVDKVRLTGSLRTMREAVRSRALERLQAICETGAAAYECRAELRIVPLNGPVDNSNAMTAIAKRAATAACGIENLRAAQPSMGCEDFAAYAPYVPSFFYFLGSGEKEVDNPLWHKPDFRCAPGTAVMGAKLLTSSVLAAQGII